MSAGPNDQHLNIAFICRGGDPETIGVNYSSDIGTPGQSMYWRGLSRSLGDGHRDGQRYVEKKVAELIDGAGGSWSWK